MIACLRNLEKQKTVKSGVAVRNYVITDNNSSTSPDDDFEDCDWINAGKPLSVSGFLIEACAMYAVITMVK